MQFAHNYTIENKIKSLSSRLSHLAKEDNSARFNANAKIRSENLKFNLSFLLTQIILRLNFFTRNQNEFQNVIDQYNSTNGTNLTYYDFEGENWILNIGDEIYIPEVIRYAVRHISYEENEGRTVSLPFEKKDLIRCIKLYYDTYIIDVVPTISHDELTDLLETTLNSKFTKSDLVSRGILLPIESTNLLRWHNDGSYVEELSSEIAALLWNELGTDSATTTDFKKFFRILRSSGVWPKNIANFLSQSSKSNLCMIASKFLAEEKELDKSDDEFKKMWLNGHSRGEFNIGAEIPKVEFDFDNLYSYLESMENTEWIFPNVYDHQYKRTSYRLVLRFIAQTETNAQCPYQTLISTFKNLKKPFIVWSLYNELPRVYPEILPFLLNDTELVPLVLKQIDKLKLDENQLPYHEMYDEKLKENHSQINTIWDESFRIVLDSLEQNVIETVVAGKMLGQILADVAEKVFNTAGKTQNIVALHNLYRTRYENTIKLIDKSRFLSNSHSIIIPYLPALTDYLIKRIETQKPKVQHYLKLNSGLFDLCIKIISILKVKVSEPSIVEDEKEKLETAYAKLLDRLYSSAGIFYTTEEIQVATYDQKEVELRNASRTAEEFGFEIINWGYLFLHFEKNNLLENFDNIAIGSIKFLVDVDIYIDQNRDQIVKLKLYIKSLLLGFLKINETKSKYQVEGLPVAETIQRLEVLIKKYAIMYSTLNLSNSQVDIFTDQYASFGYELYYQHMSDLLYKSIVYFDSQSQKDFTKKYFSSNSDISRLLGAINIIEDKDLQNIIAERISQINVQDYIAQRMMATDLEYALVGAVNSEYHWSLAEPLLTKLEQHSKRVGKVDINTKNFYFEINLLLAFKQKDFKKLSDLVAPPKQYAVSTYNEYGERIKLFFMALHKLYNEKNYAEGIKLFGELLIEDPKNIRYAFHKYCAQTLKSSPNDKGLLIQANHEWETFLSTLSTEEKKAGLPEVQEEIFINRLPYLEAIEEWIEFDQIINRLSKKHLYKQEVIPTIYRSYHRRSMYEMVFSYVSDAEKYLKRIDEDIVPEVKTIFQNFMDTNAILRLKETFGQILGLQPTDLISVVPQQLNGKRDLSEFILGEFILAAKILIKKIHGVEQITHENRFNDLLVAILSLRFPIWGWKITDQPRSGSSATGLDAGEVDFEIIAGGAVITIFEALILSGRDATVTQNHIKKMTGYSSSLDTYYLIVYYTGKPEGFDDTWEKYKEDIETVAFAPKFKFDDALGFQNLANDFTNVTSFKIAKTKHSSCVIFHIMIDLSREQKKPKVK